MSSALAGRSAPLELPLRDNVQACLQHHLSRISANLVLGRACTKLGLTPRAIAVEHLDRLISAMEPLLVSYLSRLEIRETLQELRSLKYGRDRAGGAEDDLDADEAVIEISVQEHIDAARTAALRVCRDSGLSSVDAVKVATVVSELSRNICQYATRGEIRIRRLDRPRPGIRVVAQDEGPGIPHLEEVERGQWRSQTGLGLGLTGSRKLMSTFDIQTTLGHGTLVTAEKYIL